MTRREWRLTLSAGLCAALLSACTRSLVTPANPGGPWPAREQFAREGTGPGAAPETAGPQAPRLAGLSGSPYHAHPVPPPDLEAGRKDEQVRQTPYPGPTPPDETAPPAEPRKAPDSAPDLPVIQTRLPAAPETEARAKPPADPPLVGALRCFLEKRPEEAVALLQCYDKPNQEILLGLLPLARRLTEGSLNRTSRQEVSAMVDQLQSVAVPLRTRAELVIDKMCFCEQVKGFGVYKALPEDHAFQAATADRPGELVQVYVELRNFAVE